MGSLTVQVNLDRLFAVSGDDLFFFPLLKRQHTVIVVLHRGRVSSSSLEHLKKKTKE